MGLPDSLKPRSAAVTLPLLDKAASSIPIQGFTAKGWETGKAREPAAARAWADTHAFTAKPGQVLVLPDPRGGAQRVLAGWAEAADPFSIAAIAAALPAGSYRLENLPPGLSTDDAALGWVLASYAFRRYRGRGQPKEKARLILPKGASRRRVEAIYQGITLARDLINTPANDLGPAELAAAVQRVAKAHRATCSVIAGAALLKQNYPMIHMVGRAATAGRAPRLIDLRWGNPKAPKVTLVGKGVCFDSGGLDIKPASGMLLMKKDMGGAAIMLGLAQAVMALKLPVRLRLLIPAVENAVSAESFRPGDVVKSRAGLTVEIGNTDAEGRLILADALAEADSEKPDLLLDAATLTGAARVALGPDLPALMSPDDRLAEALLAAGRAAHEPLWRLPLHTPYRSYLDSKIADINNAGDTPFAGTITAGLFLKDFVRGTKAWAHLDTYAWTARPGPGRPAGGEATGLRAMLQYLETRFGG